MQNKTFALADKKIANQDRYSCSYDDLSNSPHSCIKNAAETLVLNLSDTDIEESVEQNLQRHSKIIDREYAKQDAVKTNSDVLFQYQKNFSQALHWKSETLDAMPI